MDNYDKCNVIRICNTEHAYRQCEYLTKIESPTVRSIFTRLRIDCNNLNDCRFRSYRFKRYKTDKCTFCPGEKDTVTHLLFHCKHPDIVHERNIFHRKYSSFHNGFVNLSDNDKLYLLLNVSHTNDSATSAICTFIKRIYGTSRCLGGGSADL